MRKALIFFLLLLSVVPNPAIPNLLRAETLIGTAKHKGKTIYLENHEVFYQDLNAKPVKHTIKTGVQNPVIKTIQRIDTKYINRSKEIGFRQQEFFSNHYIPNLVFKDILNSDTYSITVNDKKAVLKSYLDKTEKTTDFKITKDMVVTDSLSKFIFENFDDLLKKPMLVKCLMPRSHSFIKLTIKKHKEKNNLVTFVIRPSSILLKYLAEKTYVTFDKTSKNWVEYQGFSNLKSKKGKILDVEIDYLVSQSKL